MEIVALVVKAAVGIFGIVFIGLAIYAEFFSPERFNTRDYLSPEEMRQIRKSLDSAQ